MRRKQNGFTLIELMIVITIIGLLAAMLLPDLLLAKTSANVLADSKNLTTQHQFLLTFKAKLKRFPKDGGAKFVLEPWVREVVPHTVENFDKYFTPGITETDAIYSQYREKVLRGENPWPNIEGITSADTHYAGRAQQHITRGMEDGNEAWLANDNEGGWSFQDGTLNLVMGSGVPRTYSYQELEERYQLPKFSERKNDPLITAGEDSPITECKKLAY